MEVQGFSCPFSGFCEGLRAFSIKFCSSLAFHWYPKLEGPLFVTLSRVYWAICKGGPVCIIVWWHLDDNACVQIFRKSIHFFTTHVKFVFFWVHMASLHCLDTTWLNQAQGANWGCSLWEVVATSNCSNNKGGLLPFRAAWLFPISCGVLCLWDTSFPLDLVQFYTVWPWGVLPGVPLCFFLSICQLF